MNGFKGEKHIENHSIFDTELVFDDLKFISCEEKNLCSDGKSCKSIKYIIFSFD